MEHQTNSEPIFGGGRARDGGARSGSGGYNHHRQPTIADLPPWAMARLFDLAGSLEQQAAWAGVCKSFNTAFKVVVADMDGALVWQDKMWGSPYRRCNCNPDITRHAAGLLAFAGRLRALRRLDLRFVDWGFEAPAAAALAAALAAAAPTLKDLTLLHFDADARGSDALFAFELPALESLVMGCGQADRSRFGISDNSRARRCALPALLRSAQLPRLKRAALVRCGCASSDDVQALVAPGRASALDEFTVHACGGVKPWAIKQLASGLGPRLKALNVSAGDSDYGDVKATCFDVATAESVAESCPQLRSLRVSEGGLRGDFGRLNDHGLKAVARNCPLLEELHLTNVRAGGARALGLVAKRCPRLRSLRLRDTLARDAGICAIVARSTALTELVVAGCYTSDTFNLFDNGEFDSEDEGGEGGEGAALAAPPATLAALLAAGGTRAPLSVLEVPSFAPDPNDVPLSIIEFLLGSEPDSPPNAAPPLSVLLAPSLAAGLTRLRLDWLQGTPARIQAALEAALRACAKLTWLSIAGCKGDVDALLAALACAAPPLAHLDLANARVTDAALRTLAAAPFAGRLRSLSLTDCEAVTDDGLGPAGRELPALEVLDVYDVPYVGAPLLEELVRHHLTALKVLHLSHRTGAACEAGVRGDSWRHEKPYGEDGPWHLQDLKDLARARGALVTWDHPNELDEEKHLPADVFVARE